MRHVYRLFAATLAITAPLAAQAQEDRANARLDGLIGFANDDSEQSGPEDSVTYAIMPSFAYGNQVVVQADAMVSGHRDSMVTGGALHAGLNVGNGGYVGVYGSRTENDIQSGLALFRAGGEIDFDLGQFGIAAVAGYEDSEAGSFLIRTTDTDTIYDVYEGRGRLFAFTDLRFQPSDRFRLSVGHRYNGGQHGGAVSTSVAVRPNIALFAEGRLGEGDNNGAFFGVRALFGGSTSNGGNLLDNRLLEDLFTFSNRRSTSAIPLPPPEDDDDDNGCCGGYCEA